MLFISLPLTPSIKKELHRHCIGLPNVEWQDDFFISLQKIEIKNQGLAVEIQDCLTQIHPSAFFVTLKSISVDLRQKNIYVEVSKEPTLEHLIKSIEKSLKGFDIRVTPMAPQIVLGHFQTASPERLATYLEGHASLFLPTIPISSFDLLVYHKTAKRTFFTRLQSYPLYTSL